MKLFVAIASFLFALPAFGQRHIQGPECKGVVHGVVLGRDGETVSSLDVTLYPLGVSLSYMLPHMKTSQRGEYRFEQLCSGRYSVFVTDTDAGYPLSSPYLIQFLYGGRIPQVKITDKHLDAQLSLDLPPKPPAQLQVRIENSKTESKLEEVEVQLRISRKRRVSYVCHESSPCDSKPFLLLPPDQDVLMRVTASGFHEWRVGTKRGKIIRVPSGELLTIKVALDPIGD
jgi:hypothetical protein